MPDILFFGHKEFPCGPTRGTKRFLRTWPPHKPLQVSIAMRALGLAVSKNLDRIHWQSRWVALGAHSLSDHSICSGCMPSCSQVTTNPKRAEVYVRQRCVFKSTMFIGYGVHKLADVRVQCRCAYDGRWKPFNESQI